MSHNRTRFALTLLLLIALILSGCSAPFGLLARWLNRDQNPDPADTKLIWADSYDDLLREIYQRQEYSNYYYARSSDAPQGAGEVNGADASKDQDHSTTNIQVEGVEEADIIQTDGQRIFLVANQRLIAVDASDPAAMRVLDSVRFELYKESGEERISETPLEMYLLKDSKKIVLLTSGWVQTNWQPIPEDSKPDDEKTEPGDAGETQSTPPGESAPEDGDDAAEDAAIWEGSDRIMPYYDTENYTTTRIYDISNPSNLKLVQEFSQEGYYMSSRMIDSAVYVITQKHNYRIYSEDYRNLEPDVAFPAVKDGEEGAEWETVPAEKIAILPDGDMSAQIIMMGMDTESSSDPDILTVIGSGGQLYASLEHLYMAATSYPWGDVKEGEEPEIMTDIYRFRLADGRVLEAGKGTVPGAIINQFCMDEHNGYFRIATTSGNNWMGTDNPSTNNVYILDEDMKEAGSITGLASGETIHSVRFLGDRAYMVTFRTVDPLFALDLSNPENPKVLGELKIPGYSTYLHPYSENLLLGFGYDVWTENDQVMNLGLKVSLFDISDMTKPREISTYILGGSGSYSEVLYEHKSLLFSQEKNLIAFPAALTPQREAAPWIYKPPIFQGLILLDLDSSQQIVLKGYISHTGQYSSPLAVPDEDLTGPWKEYPYYDLIKRGAYIGNTLFTFSGRQIRATDLTEMKSLGVVKLPGYDEEVNGVYYYDTVVPR